MSDSPPTKPKVGSLRDRIAAFEQKPAATPPDRPAPAPRPKPGGLAWKPKAPSPAPDSPAAGSTSPGLHGTTHERKVGGGMSASDAKESIGQGGSLKDRMAALQGKGAFGGIGGGGGPPPPKPTAEKPKWKPPPVVSPILAEGDHEAPTDDTPGSIQSPTSPSFKSLEGESPNVQGIDEPIEKEEHSEADPEEEERQRRAAIAARMARLGGTKVGMQPPVFGKKPSIKRADTLKDEEQVQSSEGKPAVSPSTSMKFPPAETTADANTEGETAPADYFAGTAPQRKSSTSSSMLSVESVSQPASSMPVPAMPRRAAPPRKKAAKSPSPTSAPSISDSSILDNPPDESSETSITVSDSQHEIDRAPEIGHVDKDADSVLESVEASGSPTVVEFSGVHTDAVAAAGDKQPEVYMGPSSEAEKQECTSEEPSAITEKDEPPLIGNVKTSVTPTSQSENDAANEVPLNNESAITEQTEEEEEAARKKRVAEKLAKMGGFNPFAPRPVVSPPVELGEPPSESPHQDAENIIIQAPKSPPAHEAASLLSDSPSADIHSESTLPESEGHNKEDDLSIQNADPTALDFEKSASAGVKSMRVNDGIEGKEDPTNKLRSSTSRPPAPISTQPQTSSDDDTNAELGRFSPPPSPVLPTVAETDDERELEETVISPQSSSRPIPPPPNLGDKDDFEGEPEQAQYNLDEEILPPPPPRRSMPPPPRYLADTRPANISPPLSQSQIYEAPDYATSPQPSRPASRLLIPGVQDNGSSVLKNAEENPPPAPPRRSMPPPPRRQSTDTSGDNVSVGGPISPSGTHTIPSSTLSTSTPRLEKEPSPEQSTPSSIHYYNSEVLDEEQGDPIDPGFHSPINHSPDKTQSPAEEMFVTQSEVIEEEDSEQTRRRTIAERMAKLGGIKFGAAPPIGRPPPSIARTGEPNVEPSTQDAEEEPTTEEEEERARKRRIAAKLAGMGGVGMFGAPQRAPPPFRTLQEEQVTRNVSSPPPLHRPSPQQDLVSELDSQNTAKDELHELEEHHDNDVEEEAPPPLPSRAGRPNSIIQSGDSSHIRQGTQSPPPVPGGRPPVPSIPPNVANRKTSGRQSSGSYTSSVRVGSFDTPRAAHLAQGSPEPEYEMVDEPEPISEGAPAPAPAPPPRPNRGPPSRPPPPVVDAGASGSAHPSVNFDGTKPDLSSSYESSGPEALSSSPPPPPPHDRPDIQQQSIQAPPPKPPTELNLSPDELTAVWGRIGVQIFEAATTLFEKSKKSLIGDGSYHGFITAVLSEVPSALPPSSSGYGYLIYSQNGSTIQRRVSDIMPGDVVALYDAKLGGRKGLTGYHQQAGSAGEPLVGIVSEFEPKKSKIKVFQANQHVGQQQTVESVSYRLEDLKSGIVKIFRVLHA